MALVQIYAIIFVIACFLALGVWSAMQNPSRRWKLDSEIASYEAKIDSCLLQPKLAQLSNCCVTWNGEFGFLYFPETPLVYKPSPPAYIIIFYTDGRLFLSLRFLRHIAYFYSILAFGIALVSLMLMNLNEVLLGILLGTISMLAWTIMHGTTEYLKRNLQHKFLSLLRVLLSENIIFDSTIGTKLNHPEWLKIIKTLPEQIVLHEMVRS